MSRAGPGRVRWWWLLGAMTLVALLFAIQVYVVYRAQSLSISFRGMLALQIGHWYCWVLAGPFAWWCATRWPIRAGDKLRNAGRHILIGVGVSVVVVTVYIALYYAVLHLPMTSDWFTAADRSRSLAANALFLFVAYFQFELIVYGAVVAVAHAVRSSHELRTREHEALQLSSQLATARLQVLTAQLQPHFLFNTLHTIGSLILQRKNDQAMQILAELGELLRITLRRQNAEAIPLSDEVEHLQRYLRIEETRFGDRLTVRWEVEPAALDALVPPLILQPLVENALKHGVAARIEPATLVVRAATAGDRLRISVRNDGPMLPAGWSLESSSGFGLRNVRDRLKTRGADCALTVENAGNAGVHATIEIPMLMAARTAAALRLGGPRSGQAGA